jgi:hypothetical protein
MTKAEIKSKLDEIINTPVKRNSALAMASGVV